MPRIRYQTITFNETKQALVDQAIQIIADYRRQGYQLTLRQLYYRFVAGDLLPESWADPKTGSTNNERSYKKLGDIIADARLGGYIDWTAIEDRTVGRCAEPPPPAAQAAAGSTAARPPAADRPASATTPPSDRRAASSPAARAGAAKCDSHAVGGL